jgi:hypothetical protein
VNLLTIETHASGAQLHVNQSNATAIETALSRMAEARFVAMGGERRVGNIGYDLLTQGHALMMDFGPYGRLDLQ